MATVETLRVGDRIADKYIIERVLGKGGMGMVVAARHVDLDQMFAIKFILPEALKQQGTVERLLREARASAKLRSEHVTKVIDVGRTQDGAPYLVMELLEGRDLAQMLDERTVIPVAEAALYVGQACEAIAEAHAAGIIHRDIKPANLFLTTRRDGSPCVKVLDFGIAKEESLADAAMTSTGSILGTPMYMSPEQVRSSKTATPATDIWALGISLYELTTGGIPYDVTTVTELIAKILTEAPIPPRARNPSLAPEIEAVIMRCLQVDPAHRYRTAADLQAALAAHGFQRSLATTGSGPLSGPTQSSSAIANPFPAQAVTGQTPLASERSYAGPSVGTPVLAPNRVLPQTTESSTSVAIRPPKASRVPLVALAVVGVLGVFGGGAVFMLTRTPPLPAAAASALPVTESAVPSPSSPVTPSDAPPPSSAASAAPADAPSAAAPPSADVPVPAQSAPSAPGAKAEPPRNASKKPPAAPRPPDRPAPAPTAKPGWGGLL